MEQREFSRTCRLLGSHFLAGIFLRYLKKILARWASYNKTKVEEKVRKQKSSTECRNKYGSFTKQQLITDVREN